MKRRGSPRALPAPGAPGVAALLGAFLFTQYGYAWRVPFINDDYVFLDLTRAMPFRSIWAPHLRWVGRYYRPWSRELHYWVLQRLFDVREAAFHAASLALWLGVLLLFWALARRLAGARAAAVATAGAAALAAWGLPVVWAAGAQDLWMMLFALGSLLLFARGSTRLAALAYALALLSKETAALLPAVALAIALAIERRAVRDALARCAPLLAVGALWAALHPQLGGRLWWAPRGPAAAGGAAPLRAAAGTLLAAVDLDRLPRPEHGWGGPLLLGALGALALGLLAAWGLAASRGEPRRGAAVPVPIGRLAAVAGAWAGAGWLPLVLPSIGWHAYYGLFGLLGAWLALGALLARAGALAPAAVVALCLLRAGRAATVSRDWGDEWYQRRAAEFIGFMRENLLARVPAPPRHSRFWFGGVPSNVGFLQGDGPALRVWYRDSTLRGGLFAGYRARPAGAPRGPDFFFRYDSTAGWVPLRAGPEDVAAARAADPRWREDHERLAVAFARGADWPATAAEYAKLAEAYPGEPAYPYYAGLAELIEGDTAEARGWLERAAALPGADAGIRNAARELRGAAPGLERAAPRRSPSPRGG